MPHARPAIIGATDALIRRTNFRKAALAPWDPRVSQVWLYVLAEAAHKCEVDVHSTMLVPSHHHTEVTPRKENIADFLGRLHHPTSRALNRLLEKRGFDAMDQVWDNDQPGRMRLLDAEAQMAQLLYTRMQNVTAGLVDHPDKMPGFIWSFDHWRPGCTVEVERPDFYFDRRYHPESYKLAFAPPPLLVSLFEGDIERLIFHMKKLEREELRKLRQMRPCRPKGAAFTKTIHPFDEPRTPREPKGGLIPTFRIGSRGDYATLRRIHVCGEVTGYRTWHRDASQRYGEGERNVVFPPGTDKMARLYGVEVAQPADDAILLARGPLLEEVLEETRGMGRRALSDQARAAVEQMRTCIEVQEGDLRAQARDQVLQGNPGPSSSGSSRTVRVSHEEVDAVPNATDEVAVCTLHGQRRTNPQAPPRRIVVRRTRFHPERRATVTEDE